MPNGQLVIFKVKRWEVVSLPPCSRRFCDVSYNNSGEWVSEWEKKKDVALGRNRITYWLSVFYLTVSTDRDAFGSPPPGTNLSQYYSIYLGYYYKIFMKAFAFFYAHFSDHDLFFSFFRFFFFSLFRVIDWFKCRKLKYSVMSIMQNSRDSNKDIIWTWHTIQVLAQVLFKNAPWRTPARFY